MKRYAKKILDAAEMILSEYQKDKPQLYFISPCGGDMWHCVKDGKEIVGPGTKQETVDKCGSLANDKCINLVFIDDMGEP